MTKASADDIDLSAVWRAFVRSLPMLALLGLLAGGATYALLSQFAPRFTSEAQIQVVAPRDASNDRNADSVAQRLDKEAINTHINSLMSPDLALKIIGEEKLAQDPEFNSALRPPSKIKELLASVGLGNANESEQDRVLKAFYSRLDIYSPKESRTIGVRFTSENAELAASVANRIAETYRNLLTTRSLSQTDQVQAALQPQLDKMTAEVSAADAAVEKFRAQANIFQGGPNNTGLDQQQLADITAELTRAQAARSEADARAQSVREMVRAGNTEALPDVQRSPLIQNLVQQRVRVERQISELSATLLPAHPRMRQLRADLSGLERQIRSEVDKIVDGIEKSASIAASREASVRKSLDAVKRQVAGTGDEAVQLRQLEAVAKTKRTELERLQARFEANRLAADRRAVPVEAQIVSLAHPTSVPSFPKPLQYGVLAGIAAMMLGTALVITRALFKAARIVRPAAQAQLPAGAPRSAARSGDAVVPGRAVPLPLIVQSVPDLAQELMAQPADIGGFRTLITGLNDSVDIGGEAVELARTMAQNGADVILVDWSPEGNGLAEAMGIEAKSGLNELLLGRARFEDVVTRVPASGAHLIPAGAAVLDRDTLLDPEQLNLTLDALDTAYDYILVAARCDVARALFEAILGRFDAGIVVTDGRRRGSTREIPGTFLGFEVADIALFRLEPTKTSQLARERLARFSRSPAEARAS